MRLAAFAVRKVVWTALWPVALLPEGAAKNGVRRLVLRHHHTLPFRLWLNRGETAVQVGTPNPGTVRSLARAVGPQGRVVIVEAAPENAAQLAATVARAGLSWVTILPVAAWSEDTELELALSTHSGDHRVMLDGVEHDNDFRADNPYPRGVKVTARRLDRALPEAGVPSVDFKAITVNGAELEVLKGCEGLLGRPGLRLYVKGHALVEGRPLSEAIMRHLDARGFVTAATRGEPGVGNDPRWHRRAGGVFAYRPAVPG